MLLNEKEQSLAIQLVNSLDKAIQSNPHEAVHADYVRIYGLNREHDIEAIKHAVTRRVCNLVALGIAVASKNSRLTSPEKAALDSLRQRLSNIDLVLRFNVPATYEQAQTETIASLIHSLALINDTTMPEFTIALRGLLTRLGEPEQDNFGRDRYEPTRWEQLCFSSRLEIIRAHVSLHQYNTFKGLKKRLRASDKSLIDCVPDTLEQAMLMPSISLIHLLIILEDASSPEFDRLLHAILTLLGQEQIDTLGRHYFEPIGWKSLSYKARLDIVRQYLNVEHHAMYHRIESALSTVPLRRYATRGRRNMITIDAVRAIH